MKFFMHQTFEVAGPGLGGTIASFYFLFSNGRNWDVPSQVTVRRCPEGRQWRQIVADQKIYCLALAQFISPAGSMPDQDVAALLLWQGSATNNLSKLHVCAGLNMIKNRQRGILCRGISLYLRMEGFAAAKLCLKYLVALQERVEALLLGLVLNEEPVVWR
jgi:hypothetical protein